LIVLKRNMQGLTRLNSFKGKNNPENRKRGLI
jgi:hypothetical protein